MSLHLISILFAIFLLIYHQITTWVPLFPWNYVQKYSKKELFLEGGINGLLMGLGIACLLRGGSGFFYWYPLIYYSLLFLGECVDWWIPYFSESFARHRRIWDYESRFSRTFKLLPHQSGKRTPDANHIVLHLLTIVTFIFVYLERLT